MALIILLMTKGDKTTEFCEISTFTQSAQRPAHCAELRVLQHCPSPAWIPPLVQLGRKNWNNLTETAAPRPNQLPQVTLWTNSLPDTAPGWEEAAKGRAGSQHSTAGRFSQTLSRASPALHDPRTLRNCHF